MHSDRRLPHTPAVIRALGAVVAVVVTTAMLGGTELLAQQRLVSGYAQIRLLPRVVVSAQRLVAATAPQTVAVERQAARGG